MVTLITASLPRIRRRRIGGAREPERVGMRHQIQSGWLDRAQKLRTRLYAVADAGSGRVPAVAIPRARAYCRGHVELRPVTEKRT